MTDEIKNNIVELNNKLGIKTVFDNLGSEILGYSFKNTIYLNDSIEQDLYKTNKHELFHFFEDSDIFAAFKHSITTNSNIEQLRDKYKLRYAGIYSKEEIELGIIDIEIVIDMLVEAFDVSYNKGLVIGDIIVGEVTRELESKRYLTLNIKNNIQNMNLSKWEKIFASNYYDGRKHLMPSDNKYEIIRNDIKQELDRLYTLADNKENFRININSIELLREYNSEIKALKQRGEDTTYLEENKKYALKELSNRYTEQLHAEYKHIVDYIKGLDYEDAFKVMILRETLLKTYKKDKDKTIINKRILNETITGHMVINDVILKTIYNHIDEYESFSNIYFASLEIFKNKISEQSTIKLDGVETYNKGRWIKFEGKTTNEIEYLENSKKLEALVKDTPWCTKNLASTQLSEGDFYVFVDNNNKPHIAVKLNGNEIDEVRGLKGGNAQEIEEEYRSVAISFLENNKDIKYGKEWLEKEEWNKRLIEWTNKINNGTVEDKDVENIMKDIFYNDYKKHSGYNNTNKKELINNLSKIKNKIAAYYNCKEEEIYFGDINFDYNEEIMPYKIVIGDINLYDNKIVKDMRNLTYVFGTLEIINTEVSNLDSIKYISGSAYLSKTQIERADKLEYIGGHAEFEKTKIQRLNSLKYVGGHTNFADSKIQSLSGLEYIGGYALFNSYNINLNKLKRIRGEIYAPDKLEEYILKIIIQNNKPSENKTL